MFVAEIKIVDKNNCHCVCKTVDAAEIVRMECQPNQQKRPRPVCKTINTQKPLCGYFRDANGRKINYQITITINPKMKCQSKKLVVNSFNIKPVRQDNCF
jgi:hypothetical protein